MGNPAMYFALRDTDLIDDSIEQQCGMLDDDRDSFDLDYQSSDPRIASMPRDMQDLARHEFHGDMDFMVEAATRFQFHRNPPAWAITVLNAAKRQWRPEPVIN